ncbi:hypothetical protein [Helicobacter sp. 11S02596-1]|uniref:hypothetical protein n=1 Tax=Helicobacter sp. 11S02596-1 TaxID=1476194 RepID=UPI000BA67033|nr:hypothetical protein [Helicobacter sp. 11S02596-1]PAF44313.1 hypothetical protein BJI48_03815 [Helicobacter sp. 11S02596-1]
MEIDFSRICRENNFPTRIVPCCLEFAYGKPSEDAQQEYLKLGSQGNGFDNWLENLKGKNRLEADDELILKAISQIYAKLNALENLIANKCETMIDLEHKGRLIALGHGVLCSAVASFEPLEAYYLRFKLPIFPERYMGIFAQAFDERILRVTQMHPKDMEDFDMYIANKEMENLRAQHNRKDK